MGIDASPSLRQCDRTRLHYDTKREASRAAHKLGKDYATVLRCRCQRWRVVLRRDADHAQQRELRMLTKELG